MYIYMLSDKQICAEIILIERPRNELHTEIWFAILRSCHLAQCCGTHRRQIDLFCHATAKTTSNARWGPNPVYFIIRKCPCAHCALSSKLSSGNPCFNAIPHIQFSWFGRRQTILRDIVAFFIGQKYYDFRSHMRRPARKHTYEFSRLC